MNGLPLPDTSPVRGGEGLDWARLQAYLRQHLDPRAIAGIDLSCQMEVAQFPGGHSNLTYVVRFGATELVVRRPPLGPVAPTAHDMTREYRWLVALRPVFPLAPRPYLVCEDTGIVGSVFYVMERRHGRVVRHEDTASWADRGDDCRLVSQALVDTLADLHGIDLAAHGLSGLGKPAGFVLRQVRGWTERWQRSQTHAVPEMDALTEWLSGHVPPDAQRPTIVHGDFKLDNVMLDETFALFKVAVVLQQIFYRYARGQTDDARFATFGERVAALAREAGGRAREQA